MLRVKSRPVMIVSLTCSKRQALSSGPRMLSDPSSVTPKLLNRELSLLKFNDRVLAMAEYSDTPLLERLRYLCIVSSNLDEFFEIRISSLKEQLAQHANIPAEDGFTPAEAFEQVQEATHALIERQHYLLNEEVLPLLALEGIVLLDPEDWDEAQLEWARSVFRSEVIPMLTPIGLDPAHPFPRVYNKSLNFMVALAGVDAFGRRASIAVVQAPRALPRRSEEHTSELQSRPQLVCR